MRSLSIYPLLAFTFAAVASAQAILDPSPARVVGHPSTTPAEQLLVNNLNPNFGASGGMYSPQGIALDTSGTTPILYVADTGNNRVLAWKNATSGTLANLQSPDLIIGQPNANTTFPTINGGLYYPTGLLVDPKGNLYIADSGNNRILRYPAPFSNTGNEAPDIVLGQTDPYTKRLGNQGGNLSQFTICLYQSCPLGGGPFISALAMDASGNLFVADAGNNRVLRFPSASLAAHAVDPAADMVIGQSSFTNHSGPSGPTDKNTLYVPAGLAFDAEGHFFITDSLNRIVVFPSAVSGSPANFITAIRIAGIVTPPPDTATASTLNNPSGIVMINDGPAVADTNNNRLLVFDSFASKDWTLASGDTTLANPAPVAIAALGQGSTLTNFTSTSANAGNAQASTGGVATFYSPVAAAVAGTDLFVVDSLNNRILVYANDGNTGQAPASATANVVLGQSDFPYDSPNSIQGKEFYFGSTFSSALDAGIAVDSSTGTPHLYVSDPNNHRVLGFADARNVGQGVKADLVIGEPDLKTAVCNFGGIANPTGESVPRQPTQSSLCYPTGLSVDPSSGDLYVADSENGRVLRFPAPFNPANSTQQANLVLGQAAFTGVSNPQASQSVMVFPYGLIFDPARGLFVSDLSANRVLLFSMSNAANGEPAAKVFGQPNFLGTSNSTLSAPHHVAEDGIGQLYVADTAHNRIIVFDINSGNQSNTLTGFNTPEAVWLDAQNDVWVGDANSVYFFPPLSIQGSGGSPTYGFPAVELGQSSSLICSSGFCPASAIAITQDGYGDLYVADSSNRVGVHYPALAGTNGASFVCSMGCTLGALVEPCALDGNPMGCGLAPGAYGSVFLQGASFGSETTTNTTYPVPSKLAGLNVLVSGNCAPNPYCLAPITYVSPTQINFVIPFETDPASANPCTTAVGPSLTGLPVQGNCAEVQVVDSTTQQVLGSGSMVVKPASPGFFTLSYGYAQIAALNCNHTPCEDTQNSTSNPASQGSVLQLYLTGQGTVPNAPPDGQGASGALSTSSTPVVLVGGSQATVQYSGLAPGYPGLWQINITVPTHPVILQGFPSGVFPVQVSYEGLQSNTKSNNLTPCPSPAKSCATTIVINPPQ